MRNELEDLCADLNLEFESHDAHGYYLDVWPRGRRLMIDPTPETVWKEGKLLFSWEKGAVVVRDSTHRASKQTHLAVFNRNDEDWLDKLRVFLTDGFIDAKPVDSVTGEPL